MSQLGKVRIGHKAPDFHCDAVVRGRMKEVTLEDFINEDKQSWLLLLFIPAAFSFVCPTEVLAFQNCLDEFRDRNCEVIFASVDTKHSLWHWQNVPRQYGGLGSIDVTLLSDATHKMSRDYGVLVEEEGVCLRGMFILDNEAVVQQITLNNLTVGRSVLEALRLLEAFQAVAKHGVLCPIDWKPSTNASDTINTISNMLTESYDDRLANLQKNFGDLVVTDLDAKHKHDEEGNGKSRHGSSGTNGSSQSRGGSAHFQATLNIEKEFSPPPPPPKTSSSGSRHTKHGASHSNSSLPAHSGKGKSGSQSTVVTPTPTPSRQDPPPLSKRRSPSSTAHRGLIPSPQPKSLNLTKHNTYESRRGSHVILEFADPTSSPLASPNATPGSILPPYPLSRHSSHQSLTNHSSATSTSSLSRQSSGMTASALSSRDNPSGGGQTRFQATFEAIKKMSAGLTSPRIDFSPKKSVRSSGGDAGAREEARSPGYFDVVVEGVEA